MPLNLTPFTVADASAVLAADLSGERSATWAAGYPTEGDIEVAGRVASGEWREPDHDHPWQAWKVADDETGLVVGGVGFHGAPSDEGEVEIGYGVADSARGRGVATEAVRLVVDLARASGARRIVAGTDADNAASQRVLEKCGFTRTASEDSGSPEDPEGSGELRWALDLLQPPV